MMMSLLGYVHLCCVTRRVSWKPVVALAAKVAGVQSWYAWGLKTSIIREEKSLLCQLHSKY